MATFGKTGCTTAKPFDGFMGNYVYGTVYPLTEDGKLSKVTFFGNRSTANTTHARACVYDSSNNLVASSSAIEVTATIQEWELPISPGVDASSGDHRLCLHADQYLNVYYDSVAGALAYKSRTYALGCIDPFSIGGTQDYELCIYATYTPVVPPVEENPLISKPLVSPIKIGVPIIRSFKNRFPKFQPRVVA